MSALIDLDADRREVQHPDGFQIRLRREVFTFPAELPAEALDPILSDDLDLFGLLKDLMATSGTTAVGEALELLLKRPALPKTLIAAVKDVYRVLLSSEDFQRFVDVRPSVADYIRLSKTVFKVYAVDLGKLFGSADSSDDSGATSSSTSPGTTTSTRGASGSDPETPSSSESAG